MSAETTPTQSLPDTDLVTNSTEIAERIATAQEQRLTPHRSASTGLAHDHASADDATSARAVGGPTPTADHQLDKRDANNSTSLLSTSGEHQQQNHRDSAVAVVALQQPLFDGVDLMANDSCVSVAADRDDSSAGAAVLPTPCAAEFTADATAAGADRSCASSTKSGSAAAAAKKPSSLNSSATGAAAGAAQQASMAAPTGGSSPRSRSATAAAQGVEVLHLRHVIEEQRARISLLERHSSALEAALQSSAMQQKSLYQQLQTAKENFANLQAHFQSAGFAESPLQGTRASGSSGSDNGHVGGAQRSVPPVALVGGLRTPDSGSLPANVRLPPFHESVGSTTSYRDPHGVPIASPGSTRPATGAGFQNANASNGSASGMRSPITPPQSGVTQAPPGSFSSPQNRSLPPPGVSAPILGRRASDPPTGGTLQRQRSASEITPGSPAPPGGHSGHAGHAAPMPTASNTTSGQLALNAIDQILAAVPATALTTSVSSSHFEDPSSQMPTPRTPGPGHATFGLGGGGGGGVPEGRQSLGSTVNGAANRPVSRPMVSLPVSTLRSLRQQLDSMKAVLPILTVPAFTFSLIPTPEGGKEVATYEIVVNYGHAAYAVYRRYSEFRALHERIEKDFGKEELLPRFPGRKGLFGSTNHSREAIDRRRRELEIYIRQLVASETVRNSLAVKDFFAQLVLRPQGGGPAAAMSEEESYLDDSVAHDSVDGGTARSSLHRK